ncbi:MAG: DUF1566 domain-containing protein [Deltaproteobacteria bacterium]|nr:DUF1566 domain-containing protein [Deltaproteobacteria bacterium]
MSTGLVWLKDAGWGTAYYFYSSIASVISAAERASQVKNGNPTSLTDGSQEGDWGLPTLAQLTSLTTGTEAVWSTDNRNLNTYFFIGVHMAAWYWSGATCSSDTSKAWKVYFFQGGTACESKSVGLYVWPVRMAK